MPGFAGAERQDLDGRETGFLAGSLVGNGLASCARASVRAAVFSKLRLN